MLCSRTTVSRLSRVNASVSSTVSSNLSMSFLTVSSARPGQPGPLLNPGMSKYSACCGMQCNGDRWTLHDKWHDGCLQSSFFEHVFYLLLSSCCHYFFMCYPVFPAHIQYASLPSVVTGKQHPVFLLVLLLTATALHCLGTSIKLLINQVNLENGC